MTSPKFEPELPSYLFALNQNSREEDLALIANFYNGVIVELEGNWGGKSERSYQIFADGSVDFTHMKSTLKFCGQYAFIINNDQQLKGAWLYDFRYMPRDQHPIFIGHMKQVRRSGQDRTYCPSTQTYWKVL